MFAQGSWTKTPIDIDGGDFRLCANSCRWHEKTESRCDLFEQDLHNTSPLLGLSAKTDVLCTTIETDIHLPEIMRHAPSPFVRAEYLSVMREYGFRTMVTIEPIMDFTVEYMLFMLKKIKPEQVNIGADSGNNRLPELPAERIRELITSLKTFTHVVEKNNLRRIVA
jgi:DNA repair photolyase